MSKVSQEPFTAAVAISAIGISPQNDNVRIVGQTNGNIFGTSNGSSVLANLDALNAVPNNYIGRAGDRPEQRYHCLCDLGGLRCHQCLENDESECAQSDLDRGRHSVCLRFRSARLSLILKIPTRSTPGRTSASINRPMAARTGFRSARACRASRSSTPRFPTSTAILRIATHGRGLYEIDIPGVGIPVPRPAGDGTSGPGGAAAIVTEACSNAAVDPGENVTVSYSIQNVGGGPTTNLVATLQATGGVTLPSGPQNYGAIAPAATVTRNFTFTASGVCGDTITLTFQLQDGATNFGTVSVTYILGALVTSPASFTQRFDGVVAPALPAGWITVQVGTAPLWTTTTAFSDTAPNSAATGGTTTPGDNSLTTPTIAVPPAPGTGTNPGVQLSFRTNFNLEGGFDGGVLEISINGGAFADIVAAGGSFVAGGYNGVIGPTDSVLTGRQAWTGNSNGFFTTIVNLPAASFGQNVLLKWRTAYDTGTHPTGGGLRIDTVSIYGVTRVCCTVNQALDVTSAVSRKTHGTDDFDVALPLAGEPGIECRTGASGHRFIVAFTNPVNAGSASVTTGTGSVAGTPSFAGNNMTVNLTGVTDVQRIAVTLSGVTDTSGQMLPVTPVSANMLLGDANGDRIVDSGDILPTRSRAGEAADATNFRFDVNADGAVNSGDTTIVRSRLGNFLP